MSITYVKPPREEFILINGLYVNGNDITAFKYDEHKEKLLLILRGSSSSFKLDVSHDDFESIKEYLLYCKRVYTPVQISDRRIF